MLKNKIVPKLLATLPKYAVWGIIKECEWKRGLAPHLQGATCYIWNWGWVLLTLKIKKSKLFPNIVMLPLDGKQIFSWLQISYSVMVS